MISKAHFSFLTHNTSVETAYSRLPQTFKCSREWVGGKWVSRSESRGGSLSVGLSVCVHNDMKSLSPHKTWTNKTGRSTHCVMSSWCHGDTNTCSTCATLLLQCSQSVFTGGIETTSIKIGTIQLFVSHESQGLWFHHNLWDALNFKGAHWTLLAIVGRGQ